MGANTHASAPLVVRVRARTLDEPYVLAEQQYAPDELVDAAHGPATSPRAEAACSGPRQSVRPGPACGPTGSTCIPAYFDRSK